jgi:hypothetical protein
MNTIDNMQGIIHNKLDDFNDGIKIIQKENNEALDGTKLKDACSPYISIHAAGINYSRYIPNKVKQKVQSLLERIFNQPRE